MTDIQKLQKFLSPHVPFVVWDYKGYKELNPNTLYDKQEDWNQTLISKINQTSAHVFRDTMTGGANVLLIPESLKVLFETLIYFQPGQHEYCIGILSGRYHVYAIPELTMVTLPMYNKSNELEIVSYEESKIYVCKLKDTEEIFDIENYLKVGVVKIEQFVEMKLFE